MRVADVRLRPYGEFRIWHDDSGYLCAEYFTEEIRVINDDIEGVYFIDAGIFVWHQDNYPEITTRKAYLVDRYQVAPRGWLFLGDAKDPPSWEEFILNPMMYVGEFIL